VIDTDTYDRCDRFWANHLGLEPSQLTAPGVSVRPHVGLGEYRGLWCFRRGAHIAVSAPVAWVPRLAARIADQSADEGALMSEAFWAKELGEAFDYFHAPMVHASLAANAFRPRTGAHVRFLTAADAAAIAAFRAVCGTAFEKLEHVVASFEADAITALAAWRPLSGDAGDPCILTLPSHYGRGHGTAAASALVAWALAQGKLVLYETDPSNTPALRIAERLGFARYGEHVAIGLKNPAPAL
jgi:GNAT superfamily N-acetyltransferase